MKKLTKYSVLFKKTAIKALKWLSIAFAGLVVAAVICFFILQTDYVSGYLLGVINGSSDSESSTRVRVKNINGVIPFSFSIGEITVSDKSGKWLIIRECSVKIKPLELLKGRVFIERLYMGNADVLRLPSGEKENEKKLPGSIELPFFITRIVPGDIQISHINLSRGIPGYPSVFGVTGTPVSGGSAGYDSYNLNIVESNTGWFSSHITVTAADDIKLEISGHMDLPEGIIPEQYRDVAWREADFKMDASFTDKKTVKVNNFEIIGSDVKAAVKGEINREDLESQLSFNIALKKSANIFNNTAGFEISDAAVSGILNGKLFEPDINLTYSAADITGKELKVSDLKGEAGIGLNNQEGTVSISCSGKTGEVSVYIKEQEYLKDNTAFQFDLALNRQKELSVKDFVFNTQGVSLNISGKAGLNDLFINGSVKGVYNPELENIHISKLFKDEVNFESFFSYRDRTVNLTDILIDAGTMTLKGEGRYRFDGSIDSDISLIIPDMGFLSNYAGQRIAGSAKINSAVKGSLHRLDISSKADISSGAYGEIKIENILAEISDIHTENNETGKISVVLSSKGKTLKAGSEFNTAGNNLTLNDIFIKGIDTQVKGHAEVDLRTGLFNGNLAGSSDDMVGLSELFGWNISGRSTADLNFKAFDGKQNIKVKAAAENIFVNEGTIRDINIKGEISDIYNELKFTAEAGAENVVVKGATIEDINVKAKGKKDDAEFTVSAEGNAGEDFFVETRADIASADSGTSVSLKTLNGSFGSSIIKLKSPLNIKYSADSVSVEKAMFEIDSGDAEGSFYYNEEKAAGGITLKNIPGSVLSLAGIQGLDGLINGSITLSGSAEAPELYGSIKADDVKVKSLKRNKMPPLTLDAKYSISRDMMSGEFTLGGVSGSSMNGSLSVPFNFSFSPFKFMPEKTGDLNAGLKGAVDLAVIPAFSGLHNQTMEGILDTDFIIRGSIESPELSGRAGVVGGSYENSGMGIVLKNIGARFSADNSGFRLEKFNAIDGLNGSVTGSGLLNFGIGEAFNYLLDMSLSSMQVVRNDRLDAVLDGKIHISGSVKEQSLSGELTVEKAEFQIPEKLPAEITELEVKEINKKEPEVSEEITGNRDESRINFDLSIASPGRIYITGRGLDSEWKGDLTLTGTSAEPVINGKLSIVRGYYDFLSKSFTLTEGNVTFYGNSPPNPYLDVTGKIVNSSLTAYINVSGDLKNPSLNLRSEPDLPQDEILASVLFNREISQITPLQALSLVGAINELRGKQKGFDALKYTRNLIGVDRLEIKQAHNDPDESALSAGKYLNDNIYIEVERGISAESGKASVTWELTPDITVETEVGEDSETGMGINWKHDY